MRESKRKAMVKIHTTNINIMMKSIVQERTKKKCTNNFCHLVDIAIAISEKNVQNANDARVRECNTMSPSLYVCVCVGEFSDVNINEDK